MIFSYILAGFLVLIPLALGIILVIFPPKEMNNMAYGFHMNETTKNQDAWDYGQKIGGITMLIYSILSISVFTVFLIVFRKFFDAYFYLRIVIGLIILIFAPVISFFVVHRKTRKYNYKKDKENVKDKA